MPSLRRPPPLLLFVLSAWLPCSRPYANGSAPLDLSLHPAAPRPPDFPLGRHDLLRSRPPGPLLLSAGCHSTELRLLCPQNHMLVAEAGRFVPAPIHTRLNCSARTRHSQVVDRPVVGSGRIGDRDLRQAINRRCSGFSNGEECRFSLHLDSPESRSWGPGLVELWHRCVPRQLIHTQCGRIRADQRGYIVSGVYPKYYIGGRSCTWTLTATPPQQLELRLLDLQLRESRPGGACPDSLSLDRQLAVCGEMKTELVVLSRTGRASLTLTTTADIQHIYARRGFLLEFNPLGCSPPPPPQPAFLLNHNRSHAVLGCPRDHVFLPGLTSTVSLPCSSTSYLAPLPNCTAVSFLLAHANDSVVAALRNSRERLSSVAASWLTEVLLPAMVAGCILILSLTGMIVLLLLRRQLMVAREDCGVGGGLHHGQQQNSRAVVATLDNYEIF